MGHQTYFSKELQKRGNIPANNLVSNCNLKPSRLNGSAAFISVLESVLRPGLNSTYFIVVKSKTLAPTFNLYKEVTCANVSYSIPFNPTPPGKTFPLPPKHFPSLNLFASKASLLARCKCIWLYICSMKYQNNY